MAEKGPKAKPAAKSVLGTLPATRHERLGAPRNGTARKPRALKRAPGKAKPRAVTPASPPLTRKNGAPPPRPLGAPKGTELVTTAIRATGELAQIGFMLSGKAIKRAVDHI